MATNEKVRPDIDTEVSFFRPSRRGLTIVTRMSKPQGISCWCRRKASRITRLIRLRTAALPCTRPTDTPIRAYSKPFTATCTTSNWSLRRVLPASTALNSLFLTRRYFFGNVSNLTTSRLYPKYLEVTTIDLNKKTTLVRLYRSGRLHRQVLLWHLMLPIYPVLNCDDRRLFEPRGGLEKKGE